MLKLPAVLAPIKAAVLPLVKKDGLPEVAKTILADLQWDFNVVYDEKDAVGRRYRRQDALEHPFVLRWITILWKTNVSRSDIEIQWSNNV